MDDGHEIAGYIKCSSCGEYVVEPVAHQTGRKCVTCWSKDNPLYVVEVMNRGTKTKIQTASQKNKRTRNRRNKGRADSATQANNARLAAMRRLKDIHADLYALLYDEERVRRGLPALIRREQMNYDKIVAETLAFDAVYDALESLGADNA